MEDRANEDQHSWRYRVLKEQIAKLERQVDFLTERLSKVENKINMAIGGIGVLGVTAITNLITNILQNAGQ